MPNMTPPTMMPKPLVKPPMIATAKALRPNTAPMVAPVKVSGAISAPAKPAVADDSALDLAGLRGGAEDRVSDHGFVAEGVGGRDDNSKAHCCKGGEGTGAHGETPEIGTSGRRIPAGLENDERPVGTDLSTESGRYWVRTSDPQLVELVLSQLS